MKLFISWSGDRSRLLAESLHWWIPKVINAVEPWLSADDIAPGKRWSSELADQLEKTSFGIICLTRENLNAPWILFEAGALSKFVDSANVVPFLLDNKPSEIQGPLAQFQSLQVNKDNVNKLLVSVNKAIALANERNLSDSALTESFEVWWSKLEERVRGIPKTTIPEQASARKDSDVLAEILVLVRGLTYEMQRSTGMSTAEQALNVLLSSKNIGNKEFVNFLESLPKEDQAKITNYLLGSFYRDSFSDIWHHLDFNFSPTTNKLFGERLAKRLKKHANDSAKDDETTSTDNSPRE